MPDFPKLPSQLPGTRKLFYDDPYRQGADAEVLWAHGDLVLLDATIFYAESGGQECDFGTISGHTVIDVQDSGGTLATVPGAQAAVASIAVGTCVLHRIEGAVTLRAGDRVELAIDWERRYANMRNHSACHFMYAAIQELFGVESGEVPARGCHIHPGGSRMDFAADLDFAQVMAAQELANAMIARGLEIVMQADPGAPGIYIWTCGNLRVPCGGTHVRSAAELAPLSLKRTKKGAGLTRIGATIDAP